MLIYAGIDEAGYGPMLGPLCVAGTVFVLPGHDPANGAPDLWKVLRKAVCRKRTDRRHRIAVDDSKRLKGAKDGKLHPLTHLERGVLGFLTVVDSSDEEPGAFVPQIPHVDDDLIDKLHVPAPDAPWYGTRTELPLAHTADELRIVASKLLRVMHDNGVLCAGMRCDAIDAGPFNQHVARTKSKANVNMAAALRLVDRIWRRWPNEHPRIILDRHGGRLRYREDLQLAWPDAAVQILAEGEALSRYRLSRNGSHITMSFMREADGAHLPVALASMTAKFVRELFMLRFNRFFQQHLPELKPTAGYVQDARRYLRDIDPLIAQLEIDRGRLVRSV